MKRRRYSKLLAAVFGSAWAIRAEKFQQIMQLLDLRTAGFRFTRQELRARLGEVHQPPLRQDFAINRSGQMQAAQADAPRIAVLNVFGTITQRANMFTESSGGTSTELLGTAVAQAVADESVAAIVLNVDSPGGSVSGVPELAEQIFAARGAKPIVSVVNPEMASAAYYIGSAAGEVVATPSAMEIGHIGVFTIHRDESAANADDGLKYTIIRSVAAKAEWNGYEPLTDAAREHAQDGIDKLHAGFVAAVAKHRGVAVGRVNADFGQGRGYLAADALARGLIDRIATFDEVISELSAQAGTGRPSLQSHTAAGTRRATITVSAKECPMDPKVKLALIRAGLAKAGDTDAQFTAALALFYQARGAAAPDDAAQIVKDLEPPPPQTAAAPATTASTQPSTAPQQPTNSLTAVDILGLVATAGGLLPAEQRLALQTELLKAHAAAPLSLAQVLDKINAQAVAANPPAGRRIEVTADARDKFTARARDAILCATWQGSYPKQIYDFRTGEMRDWQPAGAQREFGLQSPIKLGLQCLIAAGYPAGQVLSLSKAQVAQVLCGARPQDIGLGGVFASSDGPAYNVTGMFGDILLDARNVLLRRSYDDGRTTFQVWMRQGASIENFMPVHRVIAGELGDPKAIPEDGTFDETTLSEGKESYKLTVWGQVVSLSWQLLVNDYLGSFTELPVKMGRAMRRKQNRIAYAALKDNGLMGDGVALFHATHKNLTTGVLATGEDYIAAWNTMAQKMAEQTGLDASSGALNFAPRYIVFPSALRGIIRQTLGSPSVDTTNPALVNIWEQSLIPVEEAELGAAFGGSDTAFYWAADAGDVDTIEYAFMQGLEAPRIEQETAFDRLAIRQRIYHAFGVKALDHRGLQKHTGAA